MNESVRWLFEEHVYPNFAPVLHGLKRKPNGEYYSDTLEDHWQTFQEGFELAVIEVANLVHEHMDAQNAWITRGHIKEHFGVK